MEEFVAQLKPFLTGYSLAPHISEEYLEPTGLLDLKYVQRVTGLHSTRDKFNAILRNVLGICVFEVKTHRNEVSLKEFLEIYQFGQQNDVRAWISVIHARTGKLLTRQKLFEYILK